MRAYLSFLLPVTTMMFLLPSAPHARADFCWKYAKTAVQQQKANIDRRCGFSGARWHLDRGRHRLWCNFVSRRTANRETRIRARMLRGCPRVVIVPPRRQPRNDNPNRNMPDRCRDYANRAVEAYNRYSRQGCRLSAPRGFTPNYTYCKRVSPMQAEQALSNMIAQGEACLANRRRPPAPRVDPGKRSRCNGYARDAVELVAHYRKFGCALPGAASYNTFYARCMRLPDGREDLLLKPLRDAGNACIRSRNSRTAPAPGGSKTCRNYARRAYALTRTIRDVCSSGHYRVDYNSELRACMSWPPSRRAAMAADGLRVLADALARCPRR